MLSRGKSSGFGRIRTTPRRAHFVARVWSTSNQPNASFCGAGGSLRSPCSATKSSGFGRIRTMEGPEGPSGSRSQAHENTDIGQVRVASLRSPSLLIHYGEQTMAESITPEEAVELYLKDRKSEVAKSTHTNHKYRLWRFLEWCEAAEFDDMSEITGKKIYEYKIWRREEGEVNSVTLNNQLRTFRVFLRFCESVDFVEKGTAERVMLPDIDPGEDSRDTMIDPDTARSDPRLLREIRICDSSALFVLSDVAYGYADGKCSCFRSQ